MIEKEIAGRPVAAAALAGGRTLLDMNAYQWTVLFAAWLGWGFDIFDSLLFNYVAPNAVPVLLGLPLGSAAARAIERRLPICSSRSFGTNICRRIARS